MSIASRITSIEGHISDIYDSVELTGVDTTDIDKNLVNVPNTLKEGYIDIINNGTDTLYNNFPKVSGEGTSLTLNNTYQAPMRNILKGNTSQTGTPTPTSPIPVNVVSGENEILVNNANFLKLNDIAETTKNGVTYSCTNGVLKLSGTATSGILIDFEPFYLPSGTYYLNRNSEGSSTGSWQNYLRNSSSNIKQGNGEFNNSENQEVFFRLYMNSGVSWGNEYIFRPMINLGTTALTYEPYQGNTYNIDLPVENLVDTLSSNSAIVGSGLTYTRNADGSVRINGTTNRAYDYVITTNYSFIAGETYTFSWEMEETSNINPVLYMQFNANNGNTLNLTKSTKTITRTITEAQTLAFKWSQGANKVVDFTFKVQVEKGSKASPYTPYGSAIELCKIGNYQNYFYKDSDKWYLHKEIGKVVLNGSESWTSISSYDRLYYYITISDILVSNNAYNPSLLLSNNFMGYSNMDLVANNISNYGVCRRTNQSQILFRNIDISTSNDFKTWLSIHNTSVYYPLATPTNTEITDTTLINQLEELYIAKSKENQTNISQINNDLPFIISASALKKG